MLRRLGIISALALLQTSGAFARPATSEGVLARSYPMPPVLARAAVVMDARTGNVLGAVNQHLRLPMASTTKIMTAIVALRLGSLDDRVKVPKAAFNFVWDATVMGLKPGQVVSLQDLLYGLLLPSGADAANTIAIHYAGSEQRFVDLMNQEAVVLGLHDTHYVDTSGLTTTNHYSSAYDLASLARYASTLPTFMKIVGTRYYRWHGQTLTNINHVLFWYPGVDGIKPGWTSDAGICQVLDAWRNGRHVVAAILNTPNLVTDARNLLNFGLRDFTWAQSPLQRDSPAILQAAKDGSGPYQYFPASGHELRGAFLRSFQNDGGSASLGYPRTEPLQQGSATVQYFENGALSMYSGKVQRLRLGLTPLPTATPKPSPPPVPGEFTERRAGSTLPVTPEVTGTTTPSPRPTSTATPPPRPTPTPRPTATAAKEFQAFQKNHWNTVGVAAGPLRAIQRYDVQMFAYAGMAYDHQTGRVYLLPLGDRLLSARHFLARHPGNSYPAGFAPVPLLKAIGWLPNGVPFDAPSTRVPGTR
jgi:D-alanyl-D-alanine carboxypeptidase